MIKIGLDKIFESDEIELLKGRRVGLIANPASVDARLEHAADLLAGRGEFELAALFGPQHGIRGETQDNMIEWEGFEDPALGVQAYSLYGATRKPTPEMLDGLDALVYDVQDVGTRIYTFIWTMALAMQACAEAGVAFLVLDRPNPIGGLVVEGNVLDPAFASFVGLYPIPMRHGLTVGELARLFNEEFGIGCELHVTRMEGWRRGAFFDETGLEWVMPSPNMPTLDAAIVYPGTVLFEGTNISEGRGTTRPFELIGAPWLDARLLADRMNAKELPGVRFRPCHFMPTFHKGSGEICAGVQFHVNDRVAFRPFAVALRLLSEIRAMDVEKFEWKAPPYEYEYDKPPIDVMCGTDAIRLGLEAGESPEEMEARWRPGLDEFIEKALFFRDYE